MKQSEEQEFNLSEEQLNNAIDIVKRVHGMDDESLDAEWEAARLELEQELQQNPEKAEENRREAEAGYERLMQQLMKESSSEKIDQEEGEGKNVKSFPRSSRLRGRRKVLVLAAIVGILTVGMSFGVTATSKYKLKQVREVGEQSRLISFNKNMLNWKEDELENAYQQVEEGLKIPVIKLNEIPEGMEFEQFVLGKEHAIFVFAYNEQLIYLKEANMPQSKELTNVFISDRKPCQTVYNYWLDQEIEIEEYETEGGNIEYGVNIKLDDSYYSLAGRMELERFAKMVEKLSLFGE